VTGVQKKLVAIGVLALAMPAWAQQRPAVRLEVSPRRVYQGDAVILKVIVEGLADPEPPQVPATADYEVHYHGGQHSRSSFTFSINGRTVQSTATTTFTYTLLPRRAGRISILPVTVTSGGREYQSQPIVLEVIEPQAQDYVFLELSADRTECWIEQPITVELAIWLRRLKAEGKPLSADPILSREPPELTIGWLDALDGTETLSQQDFLPDYLASSGPGLAINGLTTGGGFFSFDRELAKFMFPRGRERRVGQDGQEYEYYVYRMKKRYLPVDVGPLTFAPVRFKGAVPTEVTPNLRIRRTEHVLTFSNPLVVNVKPVPTQGRPASYCGAVGPVSLRVTAKPTEVNVGDPVTLTMKVSGRARLESVAPPQLQANADLVRDFKIPEDLLGGVMEGKFKVFTQTIRARSEQVTQIPPIEISYFDPETSKFETVRSRPIPLTVHAGALVSAEDVIGFGSDPATAKLTTLKGGIQANYTDVDALLATGDLSWSWELAGWPLAGPALFVCVWLVKLRRDRLAGDVAYARRRRAFKNAMGRLSRAAREGRPGGAADAIAACMLDYMADRCNRAGGSMTRQEAVNVLRSGGVGAEVLEKLDGLLESCESARYGQADGSDQELVRTAKACLKEMEKCRF
jgi:hypothetical protein